MDVHEQAHLVGYNNDLTPSMGLDGEWRTAAGLALQESLRLGSKAGAMDVLGRLSGLHAASVLREVGFAVDMELSEQGRDAVLASVESDLGDALGARVDGFGLMRSRGIGKRRMVSKPAPQRAVREAPADPAVAIQRLLRADSVEVGIFGDGAAVDRKSLQFVAGQAMRKQVQGFGFDGIPGKYEVRMSVPEMLELHTKAASSIAEESARVALGVWMKGGKVGQVHDWVPDSIQKALFGSVTIENASKVVGALEDGSIGKHGGAFGNRIFTVALSEQGYDVNAPTVALQAEKLGLKIVEPDRTRGQYIGPMVGTDHRAGLVRFNRSSAVELPFSDLGKGMERPKVGDRVRLSFKNGELTVSVAPNVERGGISR